MLTFRGCLNSLIGLFLLFLLTFVVGLAVQVGILSANRQAEASRPTVTPTFTPAPEPSATATATTEPTATATVEPSATATATTRPSPTRTRTPAPTATPEEVTYEVQEGDTFFDIAEQFDVTTDELQEANPDADPTGLQIGEILIIP